MAASGAWPAGGSRRIPIPSARDPFWPGLLAALSLLPSWLGLGGGWHWVLDLFAHFPWQYLIAGFAVIGRTLRRRQRVPLGSVPATSVFNAGHDRHAGLATGLAVEPQEAAPPPSPGAER